MDGGGLTPVGFVLRGLQADEGDAECGSSAGRSVESGSERDGSHALLCQARPMRGRGICAKAAREWVTA